MTIETDDQLKRYRSDHRIQVVTDERFVARCETDGLRVFPVKGGRFRHDPDQIVKLMDASYSVWPSQREREDAAAVEVARDLIRQDLDAEARRDIFEGGRVTVEWHGHAVDVDLAPDPAPHGMSEEYQRRYERTGADPYAMFSGDEPEDDWTNREGQPEFNGSFR